MIDKGLLDAGGKECLARYQQNIATRASRLFGGLLIAEWMGAIVVAAVNGTHTWSGSERSIHPHMLAALFLGGALASIPGLLSVTWPSRAITRHVIGVCQMLMSALLIDLTGGRIETHFIIFGSLAFLAFFRDWRVLVTASAVTALDHLFRGFWFPYSIYGVVTTSPWRWVEHAWWVAFEDCFLITFVLRSLTELRTLAQREAWLAHGAYHDVLTGLPNRRSLSEHFNRMSDGNLALLFVDLDRFKNVNDTMGHRVGDGLLVEIAKRVSETIREADVVARIGGDEFVVLLNGIDSTASADGVAAKILQSFGQPFQIASNEIFLSASIGVSLCPDHGRDLAELQEAADEAMYQAKAKGRNQYCLFTKNDICRRDLKHDLYNAIGSDQIEVFFQPLLTSAGEIAAFEALARWTHPVNGKVPPSEFIPLAEKSGLIVPLGEWVLRQACTRCQEWHLSHSPDLRVCVNVSAIQLKEPDFAAIVEKILAETELRPKALELEITESALIGDSKLAIEHLTRLRRIGVSISIDDFGTGYSSLGYLQELPVDRLKLDRCFINREITDQPIIVRSVVEMAHRLGLEVVAEGVETAAQLEMLRSLDCDEVQGFFFSPPVPHYRVAGLVMQDILVTDS